MPYVIKPLKDQAPMRVSYNKSLPLPEEGGFRLMINGASGQGKTVLLLQTLKQFRKHFKKIVIWSQNLRQYKKHWSRLMTKHDVMYEKFNEADLRHHYDKAIARNRKRPKRITPTLYVFDDMLQTIQTNQLFKTLLLTTRKENVSLIFTSHKYTFTAPLIRQNLTHIVLLSTNDLELGLLAAYMGLDRKEMIEAYKDSGAGAKFNFLYLIMNPAGVFFNFSDRKLLG